MRIEVPGRRPVGRPKTSWRRCIENDMDDLGIEEDTAENRDKWRKAMARPTPYIEQTGRETNMIMMIKKGSSKNFQ